MFSAKYNGTCKCGSKVFAGDRVKLSSKKIIACDSCASFGPVVIGEGYGLGWAWARSLGQDVTTLRSIYSKLRVATLLQPRKEKGVSFVAQSTSPDGQVTRGVQGSSFDSAADFDAYISRHVAREVEGSGGCEQFDRLTVGQLYVLQAAYAYLSAATQTTRIAPSQETLAWGGMFDGETLHFQDDAEQAINMIVESVTQSSKKAA